MDAKAHRDKLMMSQVCKNIAKVATGTALGQGAVVAASPILTRIYSPADFGVVALYTAAISTLIVVGSLKYDTAIPLPTKVGVAKSLLNISLAIVVIVSTAFLIAVFAFNPSIDRLLGEDLANYAMFVVFGFLLGSIYQILSYWTLRRKDYSSLAKTKVSQGLGAAITQIALGVISGPIGLLAGDAIGRSAGALYLLRRSGLLTSMPEPASPPAMEVAKEYRRFPLLAAPAGLLNALGLHLPAVFIAQSWGLPEAGAYAIVQRVFGAPMALIGRSAVQVYYGEAAACINSDAKRLPVLLDKLVSQLILLAIPIVIFSFAAPWLFGPLFGDEWEGAGVVAAVLGLMFAVQVVVVPVSQTLHIAGRQDLQLMWDVGRLLAVLGSFVLSAKFSLTFVQAMSVYSASMVACYVVLHWLCRSTAITVARGIS